uniref:(northern house mosquito) hypothetical protein n=1 Tax=Culex pipiens TaxID=7175 RepID=A0A8D8JLI4_CULPI
MKSAESSKNDAEPSREDRRAPPLPPPSRVSISARHWTTLPMVIRAPLGTACHSSGASSWKLLADGLLARVVPLCEHRSMMCSSCVAGLHRTAACLPQTDFSSSRMTL